MALFRALTNQIASYACTISNPRSQQALLPKTCDMVAPAHNGGDYQLSAQLSNFSTFSIWNPNLTLTSILK